MKSTNITLFFLLCLSSMLNAREIKVMISYLNPLHAITFKSESFCKSDGRTIKGAEIKAEGQKILIIQQGMKDRKNKLEIKCDGIFKLKYLKKERDFYGNLNISAHNGKLKIINSIDLEKYLESVVSAEVHDLKNYEAYKAQAVVSRTYTLASIERHKYEGFNLCDSTHCQLYNGYGDINQEAAKAVHETRGEILEYKGRPIWAFYHSICGGKTDKASEIWYDDADKDYLQSVTDGPIAKPYCSGAYGYRWKTKINYKKFENFAQKRIFKSQIPFMGIRIISRTPGGRAAFIEFSSINYSKTISGSDFYHLAGRYFGWDAIRSTLFSISTDSKYVIFQGKGHGHGVGMCQHGADAMAGLGYTYDQILRHYYREVNLVRRNI